MSKFTHPINSVEWVHRDTLKPNNYNPNAMSKYELELLVISILEDGWTQAIYTTQDNEIIDGFHRWTASADKRIAKRDKGLVPRVIANPTDTVSQQISTIRQNRAKGVHGVLKMSKIVADMLRQGVQVAEIMERLQMEEEEVVKLGLSEGIPKNNIIIEHNFNSAWGPKENGR
jgi:ParB-like chromosome segregation protein Spo0J